MTNSRSRSVPRFLRGAGAGLALTACSVSDPEDRVPEFQRRRAAIEAELYAAPVHPWAGSYYEGVGLGKNVSLWLGPSGRTAAVWGGCLGVYGANWGTALEQGEHLRLDFECSNPRGEFGGFPEELVPVSWGERRYLIEPEGMELFASHVNAGREPRAEVQGLFLLRDGDELRPAPGLPTVPEPYRKLFFETPLVAHIVAVGKVREVREYGYEERRLEVTVDVGRAQGAFPELMLFGSAGIFELSAVEEDTSTAYLDLYGEREPPPLVLGTELVSRRHEGDEEY